MYKVDLAVVDRYQAFSSELFRLALLGVAGYGFLLAQIVFKSTDQATFLARLGEQTTLLGVGLVALGVAAACALAHRYLSTDCVTHHVRLLRLLQTGADPTAPDADVRSADGPPNANGVAKHERQSLRRDLKRCNYALLLATASLLVGAMAVVATFALTLFSL